MNMHQEKQYPSHRVVILEMKSKEDLQEKDNLFTEGPVERLMRKMLTTGVFGEAPMGSVMAEYHQSPVDMDKLVNRVIRVDRSRVAVKISNPEMVDGVLYADVTPWGPWAGVANERFNKQLRMNAPIREALSMRYFVSKEMGVNTVTDIITLDLKSEVALAGSRSATEVFTLKTEE